ncbi:hypothetical protein [Klenkia soli]|uniref:hypothetical protein n=1 Tax=Klenkia soli TaxID=1052260 RepID=UPI00104238F6|nr:hypothetical protein [Klenkia soli]
MCNIPAGGAPALSGQRDAATGSDVLVAVAEAIHAADADEWTVLEAWVHAVTTVTVAALAAVPEEFHDLL